MFEITEVSNITQKVIEWNNQNNFNFINYKGQFSIAIPNEFSGNAILRIFNSHGKSLYVKQFQSSGTHALFPRVPAGIFFYRMEALDLDKRKSNVVSGKFISCGKF